MIICILMLVLWCGLIAFGERNPEVTEILIKRIYGE